MKKYLKVPYRTGVIKQTGCEFNTIAWPLNEPTTIAVWDFPRTQFGLHWIETPKIVGWFHCAGTTCIGCRQGVPVRPYKLLPVYVFDGGGFAVAPICLSLDRLLGNSFRYFSTKERPRISVQKNDSFTFNVKILGSWDFTKAPAALNEIARLKLNHKNDLDRLQRAIPVLNREVLK